MTENTITLTSDVDEIVFTATDVFGGYIYDNESLDSWFSLTKADASTSKRPNAHGAYSPARLYTDKATPMVVGQYFGTDNADAHAAKLRLTALFNDGRPVTMAVLDDTGVTTRTAFVTDVDIDWTPDWHFTFSIALMAPDPRRYGPVVETVTTLPTPSSGLTWNLGTNASGLFFDWGTPGTLGQATFTNLGNTTAYPILVVKGGLGTGFRVTEIETGREIALKQALGTGDLVTIDSRTRRVRLGAADVTGRLSRREWFEVPAGGVRRYQFATLGGVTGTPTLTLEAAPAYL